VPAGLIPDAPGGFDIAFDDQYRVGIAPRFTANPVPSFSITP
jgi:hypothetical protein